MASSDADDEIRSALLVISTLCHRRRVNVSKRKRFTARRPSKNDEEWRLFLLVRERSALADPYCHSAWMSVGLCVCGFVCPQL